MDLVVGGDRLIPGEIDGDLPSGPLFDGLLEIGPQRRLRRLHRRRRDLIVDRHRFEVRDGGVDLLLCGSVRIAVAGIVRRASGAGAAGARGEGHAECRDGGGGGDGS
ncbi:hypothetical protein [Brevibacterium jeotgali]|uniref:hypothetical protein n=1 Tax=Brevibacterium jeotgali TaxID=1262550 RepID=UPI001FE94011|nr:hypothetical protein [Brevibacterium jeotgali]